MLFQPSLFQSFLWHIVGGNTNLAVSGALTVFGCSCQLSLKWVFWSKHSFYEIRLQRRRKTGGALTSTPTAWMLPHWNNNRSCQKRLREIGGQKSGKWKLGKGKLEYRSIGGKGNWGKRICGKGELRKMDFKGK